MVDMRRGYRAATGGTRGARHGYDARHAVSQGGLVVDEHAVIVSEELAVRRAHNRRIHKTFQPPRGARCVGRVGLPQQLCDAMNHAVPHVCAVRVGPYVAHFRHIIDCPCDFVCDFACDVLHGVVGSRECRVAVHVAHMGQYHKIHDVLFFFSNNKSQNEIRGGFHTNSRSLFFFLGKL